MIENLEHKIALVLDVAGKKPGKIMFELRNGYLCLYDEPLHYWLRLTQENARQLKQFLNENIK